MRRFFGQTDSGAGGHQDDKPFGVFDIGPVAAARLAASQDTTPDVLIALAGNPNLQVLRAVADNPNTPPEAIARMADYEYASTIVAAHPATPGQTFERLVRKHRDGPVSALVAANPALPTEIESRLLKSKSWHVRAALASNRSASASTVARLAADRQWAVRYHAARSPNLPARSANELVTDVAPVRLQLAGNEAITSEVADRLAVDDDPWVQGVALSNPSVSAEALWSAGESMKQPAWVLNGITEHPNCPPELADQLGAWLVLGGGDGDQTFDPIACTGNPGRADEHSTVAFIRIGQEAEEAGEELRLHPLLLIRCHQPAPSPPSRLVIAAEDPEPRVRAALLNRWRGVPARVVRSINRHDPEPSVVAAANRQVANRHVAQGTNAGQQNSIPTGIVLAALAGLLLAIFAGLADDSNESSSFSAGDLVIPTFSLSTLSIPPINLAFEQVTSDGGSTFTLSRWTIDGGSMTLRIEADDKPIEVLAIDAAADAEPLRIVPDVLPLQVEPNDTAVVQIGGSPVGQILVEVKEGDVDGRVAIPLPLFNPIDPNNPVTPIDPSIPTDRLFPTTATTTTSTTGRPDETSAEP